MGLGKDGRMNYKIFGCICVVASCGGFGFLLATQYKRRIHMLLQFAAALDYMICELQYRATALPQLFRQTGLQSSGKIRLLFIAISNELESQISPNAEYCVAMAIEKCSDLPELIVVLCRSLGACIGKFDLKGQIQGIESVRRECREKIDCIRSHQEDRIRSYQTLGICAGAAIAILLV